MSRDPGMYDSYLARLAERGQVLPTEPYDAYLPTNHQKHNERSENVTAPEESPHDQHED